MLGTFQNNVKQLSLQKQVDSPEFLIRDIVNMSPYLNIVMSLYPVRAQALVIYLPVLKGNPRRYMYSVSDVYDGDPFIGVVLP